MKNLNMWIWIFYVTMLGGVALSLFGGVQEAGIMIAWISIGLMLLLISKKIDGKVGK